MNISSILRSETVALVFGAVSITALALTGFIYVGWLGIALVGVSGLFILTRLDLHDGYAIVDFVHGGSPLKMVVRQIEENETRLSPEQKIATRYEKKRRSQILYNLDTVFSVMTALGFGLFYIHQV